MADEKLEDKRIGELYEEMEASIPFSHYKEEIKDLQEKLEKATEKIERLEYFVRGLQIGDIIQRLDKVAKK